MSGTFVYSPAAGTVPGAGTQTLAATFTPSDGSHYNADTASVQLTVQQAAPAFSGLTASQSIPYGTTSVVLSGQLAAGTLVPVGESVTISAGSASTSATLQAGGSFSATLDTAGLAVSTMPYTITYSYAGDINFTAASDSSTALTVTSSQATTLTLQAAPRPSVHGQAVQLTAGVTPVSGTGTPTGTVTFAVGGTVLGTATLHGGSAVLTTSALATGTDAVVATYPGNSSFGGSAGSTSVSVAPDASTTTVQVSPGAPVYGQALTLTAHVKANGPGGGTPTGTVTFYDGSTALGTGVLQGVNNQDEATFTLTLPSVGAHVITADYGGDGDFQTSAGVHAVTVARDRTQTTVQASSTTPLYGAPVTFTVTVASPGPASDVPAGTVSFTDNGTPLGTATLNAAGVASSTTAIPLSAGGHTIVANYQGDPIFRVSSGSIQVRVAPDATTIALTSTGSGPVLPGTPLTFTATVTSNGPATGPVTGSVWFTDQTGAVLGTAPLVNGIASIRPNLSSGSHTIGATYLASADFAASSSPSLSQVVLSNVAADVSIARGQLVYNAKTGQYSQVVTIANTSTSQTLLDLDLLVKNLSSNATLLDGTGTDAGGVPYLAVGPASLPPGGQTTVTLLFGDPSRAAITDQLALFGEEA